MLASSRALVNIAYCSRHCTSSGVLDDEANPWKFEGLESIGVSRLPSTGTVHKPVGGRGVVVSRTTSKNAPFRLKITASMVLDTPHCSYLCRQYPKVWTRALVLMSRTSKKQILVFESITRQLNGDEYREHVSIGAVNCRFGLDVAPRGAPWDDRVPRTTERTWQCRSAVPQWHSTVVAVSGRSTPCLCKESHV